MTLRRTLIVGLFSIIASSVCLAQSVSNRQQTSPNLKGEGTKNESQVILIQADETSVPAVFLDALQQNVELPQGKDAWVVRVITRGGLAGHGHGDFTINSQGIVTYNSIKTQVDKKHSSRLIQDLAPSVFSIQPTEWSSSGFSICFDCYLTMLIVRRREADGTEHKYFTYWDDASKGEIPMKVRQIYENAIRLAAHSETRSK